MAEFSKELAREVFSDIKSRGKDLGAIRSKFTKLNPQQRQQFVTQYADRFGLGGSGEEPSVVPTPGPQVTPTEEVSGKPRTSLGEAIGRATEQGASLGLAKGARAASGALFEARNPEPEQQGLSFAERLERGLRQESGREEKTLQRIEKDRPVAFGVTKGITSLVPLAPALVAGAPAAIAAGAGAGGLEAFSDEENPVTGVVLGAAGGAAGIGAGKVLSKVATSLKGFASTQVLKALELPKSVLKRMSERGNPLGKAIALADDLVKKGVGSTPKTLKALHAKTTQVLNDVGEKLGSKYLQADQAGVALTQAEIKTAVTNALQKSMKFSPAEEVAELSDDLLKGLTDDVVPVSKVWDFIKHLDKTSREFSRASDPAFLSKADKIISAAHSLRGAMIKKVSETSKELAAEITLNSGAWRTLATAEEALNSQIQSSVARTGIPGGLFEAIGKNVPDTLARTTAAQIARGLGTTAGAAGKVARPLGIAGALSGRPSGPTGVGVPRVDRGTLRGRDL